MVTSKTPPYSLRTAFAEHPKVADTVYTVAAAPQLSDPVWQPAMRLRR